MIRRIVSNFQPIGHFDRMVIEQAKASFLEHFGRKSTRLEMTRDRLNKLLADKTFEHLRSVEDVERNLDLEIVIDLEMRDDIMRLVREEKSP